MVFFPNPSLEQASTTKQAYENLWKMGVKHDTPKTHNQYRNDSQTILVIVDNGERNFLANKQELSPLINRTTDRSCLIIQ